MLLTRYGWPELVVITVVAVVGATVAWIAGWIWVLAPITLVWIALAAFFRDPIRRIPTTLPPGAMLSPADGTVSAVLEVDHHEAAGGPATIVRIFLSVLDVHVNRAPHDAEVVAVEHRPGRFVNAQRDEAAEVNESNLITLRLDDGQTMGVRQVSGMIARRIVCALRTGDTVRRGQKFGMIKFGSTTELILPRPERVVTRVEKGDRVRAGLTVLATYSLSNHTARSRNRAISV